jgi:GTP cyclohydrolase II
VYRRCRATVKLCIFSCCVDVQICLSCRWTQNDKLYDTDSDIYLPSIGGTTAYIFGDLSAIHDPNRDVALRPHDECNGSDVFGTDICTCRPYLVYAIQVSDDRIDAKEGSLVVYARVRRSVHKEAAVA